MPTSAVLPAKGQVVQTGAALPQLAARAVVGASQATTSGSQALQVPPVGGTDPWQGQAAGGAVPQAAGVLGAQHRLLHVNAVADSDGSCSGTQHGAVPQAGVAAAEAVPSVGDTATPLAALVAEGTGVAAAPATDNALQQSRQDVGSEGGRQISLCRPVPIPASKAGQQQSAAAPDPAPTIHQHYLLAGPEGGGPALGRYGQQQGQLPAQEPGQHIMQGSAQPGVVAACVEQGTGMQKQHPAQGGCQPSTAAAVGRGIGVAWDAISSKWLAYLNFGGKQVSQVVVGHHMGRFELPSEVASQISCLERRCTSSDCMAA